MQAQLAAGTTLKFTVTLADYSAADGWVLSYRLAPRVSGSAIDITATASGTDHLVNVAKATTANWAAGTYTVAAWVDNGTDRYSVDTEAGEIVITPNPATLAAGADQRSQAEIALANVQSLLQGKASSGTMEYTINGRQLRSYPLPDLLRLEAKLKTDVDRERVAAGKAPVHGGGRIQRILVRAS
jgi:hypothetical protein